MPFVNTEQKIFVVRTFCRKDFRRRWFVKQSSGIGVTAGNFLCAIRLQLETVLQHLDHRRTFPLLTKTAEEGLLCVNDQIDVNFRQKSGLSLRRRGGGWVGGGSTGGG